MQLALTDFLPLLARVPEVIGGPFGRQDAPGPRTGAVAVGLRSLWPGAPLYACLLRDEDGSHAAALDEHGGARPEWADAFGREQVRSARELAGHRLAVAEAESGGRGYGAVALGLPRPAGEDVVAAAEALARSCARELAWRAEAERRERELGVLAEETALADAGELAGPLAHEINNLVNNLVLHVAILEQEGSAEVSGGLAELRRQATQVAANVREFQSARRKDESRARRADLNRAARAAARAFPQSATEKVVFEDGTAAGESPDPAAVPVALDLGGGLPPVAAADADLRRLFRFLVNSAARRAREVSGGRVRVRTGYESGQVVLRVEDNGPAVGADALRRAFDPSHNARGLELAACRSVVRWLAGHIRAEGPAGRGRALVVELPADGTGGRGL